jgi:hypothetical protein
MDICSQSTFMISRNFHIFTLIDTFNWAGIAQSVERLATGWTVPGSNSDGGEILRTCSDRPWGPPSLLYNGYRVFPWGKAAGAYRWPPTTSSVEVKERVELYLCSPSGPSWPVLGWTLPLSLLTHLRLLQLTVAIQRNLAYNTTFNFHLNIFLL